MRDEIGPDVPERRSVPRLRVDLKAMYVRQPGCTDIRDARVRNLSTKGACLVAKAPLPLGAELAAGFFLPGDPDPLVAMARVVWTLPAAGGHATGLVFTEGAAGQRLSMSRLSVFLEAMREADGW